MLNDLEKQLVAALTELKVSIEKRWAGETARKRENSVSPRTEDALVAARAALAAAREKEQEK